MSVTSAAACCAGIALVTLALPSALARAPIRILIMELQQPQPSTQSPFAGKRLYVDPNSDAEREAETLRRSRPQDAALIKQIADQPVARWLGGWVSDIGREVDNAVSR